MHFPIKDHRDRELTDHLENGILADGKFVLKKDARVNRNIGSLEAHPNTFRFTFQRAQTTEAFVQIVFHQKSPHFAEFRGNLWKCNPNGYEIAQLSRGGTSIVLRHTILSLFVTWKLYQQNLV